MMLIHLIQIVMLMMVVWFVKDIKVVLETNIWISFLKNNKLKNPD